MATATTVEHAEAQPRAEAVVVPPTSEVRGRSLWASVDGSTMTLIAIATLAIATFTYLNIRIDNLGSELRGDIKNVNTRFDSLSSEMSARFEHVNARFDKVNERFEQVNVRFEKVNERFDKVNERFDKVNEKIDQTNERIDRLTEKINELLIEQRRGR